MNQVEKKSALVTARVGGPRVLMLLMLILLPAVIMPALGEFSLGPVYHHSFMKNDADDTQRIQSPGLNLSFVTINKLSLLFSINAYVPVWLNENGVSSISFDYYQYPSGFDLLVGPQWSISLGDQMYFEPSVGLHTGYLNLSGVGYATVNSLPIGIGADLRYKVHFPGKLILGVFVAGSWELIDLMHSSTHSNGYTISAGITLGARYKGRETGEGGN